MRTDLQEKGKLHALNNVDDAVQQASTYSPPLLLFPRLRIRSSQPLITRSAAFRQHVAKQRNIPAGIYTRV